MEKAFTNRGQVPTCLIYMLENTKVDNEAICEMWAIQKPQQGDLVEANQQVLNKGTKQLVRDFEVKEVQSSRDFKGLWPSLSREEASKRNKDSYYTVILTF